MLDMHIFKYTSSITNMYGRQLFQYLNIYNILSEIIKPVHNELLLLLSSRHLAHYSLFKNFFLIFLFLMKISKFIIIYLKRGVLISNYYLNSSFLFYFKFSSWYFQTFFSICLTLQCSIKFWCFTYFSFFSSLLRLFMQNLKRMKISNYETCFASKWMILLHKILRCTI